MNSPIVLPAASGSALEAESLRLLAERLGGRRIGVVGDVALWGPEAILSVILAFMAGLSALGAVSGTGLRLAGVLAAVLVVGQLAGVRLLDLLLPRSPTWSVVVDPPLASGGAGRAARPRVVVALPTDLPLPGLTLARGALVVACLAVAVLPPVAAPALALPPLLLLWRRAPAEIATWFRVIAPVAREAGAPVLLCGASHRDARGVLGTLDWVRAGRPCVVWVVGDGPGCDVLGRSAPWRWTRRARRWLEDPAVLRLWLRGFEVRVIGGAAGEGDLATAARTALTQGMPEA